MDLFRNATDLIDFPAGAVVFSEGDPGDRMYVVREGEIELRLGDRTLAVLGEGAMLGEMALLDDAPRSATAVARTACRLAPVDRKRFIFLVGNTPYFALEVMKVMAERLRTMGAAARS
jgi:CRP-like cAMP-binding protein